MLIMIMSLSKETADDDDEPKMHVVGDDDSADDDEIMMHLQEVPDTKRRIIVTSISVVHPNTIIRLLRNDLILGRHKHANWHV
jgi:hypothetical protein